MGARPLWLRNAVPLKEVDKEVWLDGVATLNEIAERAWLVKRADSALHGLPPKHERILRALFGIGCATMTEKELSKEFRVTASRIRWTEFSALWRFYLALCRRTKRYPGFFPKRP